MNSVLFRCDASLLIGSGHVMRCRTLARELARGGIDVVFVCRRQPGDLIDLLAQEFRVLILPEQSLWPCGELNVRESLPSINTPRLLHVPAMALMLERKFSVNKLSIFIFATLINCSTEIMS